MPLLRTAIGALARLAIILIGLLAALTASSLVAAGLGGLFERLGLGGRTEVVEALGSLVAFSLFAYLLVQLLARFRVRGLRRRIQDGAQFPAGDPDGAALLRQLELGLEDARRQHEVIRTHAGDSLIAACTGMMVALVAVVAAVLLSGSRRSRRSSSAASR